MKKLFLVINIKTNALSISEAKPEPDSGNIAVDVEEISKTIAKHVGSAVKKNTDQAKLLFGAITGATKEAIGFSGVMGDPFSVWFALKLLTGKQISVSQREDGIRLRYRDSEGGLIVEKNGVSPNAINKALLEIVS